jgi:RNA-directed DNA polymerase
MVKNSLWEKITSFPNLLTAFHRAAQGKRSQPAVAAFEFRLEENLLSLQQELRAEIYQPGRYASFYIHEPKKRLISAAPFRDRVVHHALVRVIEPLFERQFVFDSYANRAGKGTHRALDRCTHYLRRFRYVLPMDVRQFFPSIDHAVLLGILCQTLADIKTLNLCQKIIASGEGVLKDEYEMAFFAGDDLLAAIRPRGLPIGNLTSQFWANVYLNGLDHLIKRVLKCRGYVRYVDDLLLFSDSKAELHIWNNEVSQYLARLRLTLHENMAQPRPCACGVPFLGFQVFPDHRRLKRPKLLYARRRFKTLAAQARSGAVGRVHFNASLQGWINHVRYADTWGLRKSLLNELGILEGGSSG